MLYRWIKAFSIWSCWLERSKGVRSKRESVKKTMQLILIPMGILTNTYPYRDLLDLRLMQVGVLIVKAMMVSQLNNSIKKKIKNLASLTPHGGLPIEARFLC